MFFNPLTKNSIDPNYKVLATAQLTMTDQTDASNLAGNLTVVNGSKSQVYLSGSSQPYNPNWQINNLVIRPYMITTNVYRGPQTDKYNPDLFDPTEYPDLQKPGDLNVNTPYIHDIKWYLIDSAGSQTLIDPHTDGRFTHTWIYKDDNGSNIVMTDERTLVVKDNILNKDAIASIMVKFSFHDPFADIRIPVAYEIQINNISTGMGSSKAAINSMDGNAFYNADYEEQLRFEANYFAEGVMVDLDDKLSDSASNLRVSWYIRTSRGWTLLDPATQDDNEWNDPNATKLYEIHRVVARDEHGNVTVTEKTTNSKGGTILVLTPGMIAGSNVIKLTIVDDVQSDLESSALESVYDYSDPTQCYIWSSNGDKLYKGIDAPGSILKSVVTYRGELFEDDDSRYDTMFDYYWYRISGDGNTIDHIYLDNGVIKFIDTKDPAYTGDNGFPMASTRSLEIEPRHIDYKATFTVDLLNKKESLVRQYRANLLRSLPDEEDVKSAQLMVKSAGLSIYNLEEVMATAYDLKAFNIAQEENIIISEVLREIRGE